MRKRGFLILAICTIAIFFGSISQNAWAADHCFWCQESVESDQNFCSYCGNSTETKPCLSCGESMSRDINGVQCQTCVNPGTPISPGDPEPAEPPDITIGAPSPEENLSDYIKILCPRCNEWKWINRYSKQMFCDDCEDSAEPPPGELPLLCPVCSAEINEGVGVCTVCGYDPTPEEPNESWAEDFFNG